MNTTQPEPNCTRAMGSRIRPFIQWKQERVRSVQCLKNCNIYARHVFFLCMSCVCAKCVRYVRATCYVCVFVLLAL